MILTFDQGTTEQLVPYTPSIGDSIGQVFYDTQAGAEEQARLLAERSPSYLTFAVIRIDQVSKVVGMLPATREGDPSMAMLRRLEGLPWAK